MKVKSIGIVGAGIMGTGIAQVCALSGLDVLLNDVDADKLEKANDTLETNLARMLSKQKIDAAAAKRAADRIRYTIDQQELTACDFLIEAATERLDVKQQILGKLDRLSRPDAVIATNTSSVSITKLASALSNPGRLIGMHFFNPVPVMGLVEVIRGARTSDDVFQTTQALVTQLDKTAINVKNSPGFVVNRILIPMLNEAIFVLQEGLATAEEIDTGMKLGANHPIGPLALADMVGLDTLLGALEVFYRDFNDPKYRPAPLLRELVDAGYLGRKAGRGFYTY